MENSLSGTVVSISVVIPHLNQPDHLRRCLASLAGQAFDMTVVEIIVVDNGSSQMPTDICADFDKVRLEQELEPGPGPARNKGVALSKGNTLAFIDADCIADRNWLAAIVSSMAQETATQILGGDVRIAVADPARLTMLEAYESIYAYRQQEYIERQNFSGTGNLAMRRDVYDAVGPFAGIEVAEDRDWGQRATAKGHLIRYVPGMIVFHPARQNFSELYVKWDRHVSHDYEKYRKNTVSRCVWVALAFAVAGSWLFEFWRISSSRRVLAAGDRYLAAFALVRIRIYRAGRMLLFLFSEPTIRPSNVWNRDE